MTDYFNGYIRTTDGETTWTGDTISFPNPLPVELISFTASVKDREVILKWTTATEKNNKGFEVERRMCCCQSSAGSQNLKWEKIGFVKGNRTISEQKKYIFSNKNLSPGEIYIPVKTYRLQWNI